MTDTVIGIYLIGAPKPLNGFKNAFAAEDLPTSEASATAGFVNAEWISRVRAAGDAEVRGLRAPRLTLPCLRWRGE
jgi:hypothetical protein